MDMKTKAVAAGGTQGIEPARVKKPVSGTAVSKGVEGTERVGEDYDVSLSSNAKALKTAHDKAYKIAKDTPAVREEKVKELKEKIKRGDYQLDSGKIADGMLREAIKDRLSLAE